MYLRRELGRRMRQAVVVALGLAPGTGLVITVTAAAEQSDVLVVMLVRPGHWWPRSGRVRSG